MTSVTAVSRCSLRLMRLLDGLLLCVMRLRHLVRVNWIVFQQSTHDLAGEMPVVAEIAIGDQLSLRMGCEPLATAAEQLLDLVRSNPVVLVVVEHRQEDKEVF